MPIHKNSPHPSAGRPRVVMAHHTQPGVRQTTGAGSSTFWPKAVQSLVTHSDDATPPCGFCRRGNCEARAALASPPRRRWSVSLQRRQLEVPPPAMGPAAGLLYSAATGWLPPEGRGVVPTGGLTRRRQTLCRSATSSTGHPPVPGKTTILRPARPQSGAPDTTSRRRGGDRHPSTVGRAGHREPWRRSRLHRPDRCACNANVPSSRRNGPVSTVFDRHHLPRPSVWPVYSHDRVGRPRGVKLDRIAQENVLRAAKKKKNESFLRHNIGFVQVDPSHDAISNAESP